MKAEESRCPDRREFLRRARSVAIFTPPLMLALGGSAARAGSAYEKINGNLQQAGKLVSESRRVAEDLTKKEFQDLGRPIAQLKREVDSFYEWHGNGCPRCP